MKVRLLSVVSAELRAIVLPGRRPPRLNIALTERKWLAAEHAAEGAALDEIPTAREHWDLSPLMEYPHRASAFVNASLTCRLAGQRLKNARRCTLKNPTGTAVEAANCRASANCARHRYCRGDGTTRCIKGGCRRTRPTVAGRQRAGASSATASCVTVWAQRRD